MSAGTTSCDAPTVNLRRRTPKRRIRPQCPNQSVLPASNPIRTSIRSCRVRRALKIVRAYLPLVHGPFKRTAASDEVLIGRAGDWLGLSTRLSPRLLCKSPLTKSRADIAVSRIPLRPLVHSPAGT